jgi:hypothetical protein
LVIALFWHIWDFSMKHTNGILGLFLGGGIILIVSGCVTRKFTVDSFPQGATVYRDGNPLGITPVDDSFVYHGKYKFTLVKDGYETLTVDEPVHAPWYAYPPLDFFVENIWPFEVRDHRRLTYNLEPRRVVTHEEALLKASALRAHGQTVQPLPGNPEPVQPSRETVPGTTPGIQPLPAQSNGNTGSSNQGGIGQ